MKVKYLGEGRGLFLHNLDFKPGVEVEVPEGLTFPSELFEVSKKVESKTDSKPTESSTKVKTKKKSK